MVWNITVISKDKSFDLNALKLEIEVKELFGKEISARSLISYFIEGNLNKEEIIEIAEKYIVDPIIEEYYLFDSEEIPKIDFLKGGRVIISFKKGVLNPNDEIILFNLKRILNDKIKNLYTKQTYYIKGANKKELEEIAQKILTNRLLHFVKIEYE